MGIGNIPALVRSLFIVGGALMSTFSGRLPDNWQDVGLYAGIAIVILGALATLLHFINEWREKHGKERMTLEPSHLIAVGLFIALAGVCWQIFSPSMPASQVTDLQSQVLDAQSKLTKLQESINKYVKPRKLSEEQIDTVAEFLLKRPSQKINIVSEDKNMEANSYAASIYRAFERAHWAPTLTSSKDDFAEGAKYNVMYPKESRGDQNVADDIRRAFKEAGVDVSGGSSRNSQTGELYVDFLIGHRPRL